MVGGPIDRGFDSYFGVDVPNWPPYCFIDNDRTVGIPSEFLPERLLGGGQGSSPGPAMPDWNFEQLLPKWVEKSEEFIAKNTQENKPFFLYLPLTSPHTPIAVNEAFRGSSGLDHPYADFVVETDDVVGKVLDALQAHGVADNTLVIFTSDNGFANSAADGEGLRAKGHDSSAPLRGHKSDLWGGGHRIPFIARWPGVIPEGSTCDQLVSLSDLMATCADIVGTTLPPNAGEDSVSILPLFNDPETPIHDMLVHHSWDGKFAVRDRRWKLLCNPGSGGWSLRDRRAAEEGLPLVQLYDMQADIGETTNLQADNRDIIKRMRTHLSDCIQRGRTTPGPDQANDVEVDLWKWDTMPAFDPSMASDY